MSVHKMARADFFSALVFFTIGVYFVFEGMHMPGATGFIEPGGEPGRVPVLIGAILAVLGGALLVRSFLQNGHKRLEDDGSPTEKGPSNIRALFVIVWCILYAVGMLADGWFDFGTSYAFATAVFIFVFIVASEWQYAAEYGQNFHTTISLKWPRFRAALRDLGDKCPGESAPYLWVVVSALIQAVLVSQIVAYLFEQEFFVQLP